MPLKKCRGCGIMHRRDRSCHWCGDRAESAWRSPAVIRSITGIAAVGLVAAGSWTMRERVADVLAQAVVLVKSPQAPVVRAPQVVLAASPSAATAIAAVAQAPEPAEESMTDTVHVATAEGLIAPSDSIRWVPAVARTWVNVRRDASRDGDVVGVIKPSDKAMLGIGRAAGGKSSRPKSPAGLIPGCSKPTRCARAGERRRATALAPPIVGHSR